MNRQCVESEKFVVADGDKGAARITLEEKPSLTVQFAAEELSRYLSKMTGGNFPVIQKNSVQNEAGKIVLGTRVTAKKHDLMPLDKDIKTDSFIYLTKGNNLFLVGNNDRGLLYCVYAFLESLGCRWLEPGVVGEEIPNLPTLKIGSLEFSDSPAFDLRGFTVTACGPVCPQIGLTIGEMTQEQVVDFIDWTAKKKQNYISFLSSLVEIDSRGWLPLVSSEMKKRDLMLGVGGHSWVNAPFGLGKEWYNDPSNMQYIAMLDGERKMPKSLTQEFTAQARTQLCVSNEEGVDKVIANAIDYIKQNPHVDVLAMFAADNMNHWCECEECLKETPSDLYIKFISRLGKAMQQQCPDKLLQFAAYIDVLMPPEKNDLPDDIDNVTMLFCRMSCSEHAFNDDKCTDGETIVTEFPRNKMKIPTEHSNKWYNAVLKKWLERYHGPVCMLDYSHWLQLGISRRGDLLFPDPEILKADLCYYKTLGLNGHISVIQPLFSWPNAYDMHMLAELNWNPDIDLQKLSSEYYHDLYGAFGDKLEAVFNELRPLLDEKEIDQAYVERIEHLLVTVRELFTECDNQYLKARIEKAVLYLEYLLLRKRFNYLKNNDAMKSEATACLREFFHFYSRNQEKIQPYFEIIDLVVKKCFEYQD